MAARLDPDNVQPMRQSLHQFEWPKAPWNAMMCSWSKCVIMGIARVGGTRTSGGPGVVG